MMVESHACTVAVASEDLLVRLMGTQSSRGGIKVKRGRHELQKVDLLKPLKQLV
jgi:hypothetical protein